MSPKNILPILGLFLLISCEQPQTNVLDDVAKAELERVEKYGNSVSECLRRPIQQDDIKYSSKKRDDAWASQCVVKNSYHDREKVRVVSASIEPGGLFSSPKAVFTIQNVSPHTLRLVEFGIVFESGSQTPQTTLDVVAKFTSQEDLPRWIRMDSINPGGAATLEAVIPRERQDGETFSYSVNNAWFVRE